MLLRTFLVVKGRGSIQICLINKKQLPVNSGKTARVHDAEISLISRFDRMQQFEKCEHC